MKTFAYRGFEASGRATRGLVEALDLKEARMRLSGRGVFVETMEPADGASRAGGKHFNVEARAAFYHELGALLRAGLPMVGALDILIASPDQRDRAGLLAGVRDRIREGESLAAALASCVPQTSAFERALLSAGARAGNLEAVSEQLGRYLDDQVRLREGLQTALLYPMLVVALAILIAALMMGFVMPQVGKLFREGDLALPMLTRIMLFASDQAFWIMVPALVLLAGAAFVASRRWRHDNDFRVRWERRLLTWPVTGRGLRLLASMRFSRTLGLLLRGGVGLVEAFDMAGRATGLSALAGQAAAASEALRHGSSAGAAVQRLEAVRDGLGGWFEAGQASGDLPGLLDQAAQRQQQQWEAYLNRLLKLIEPLLILAVGVFVLLIALAILLPILSLNRAAF